MASPANYNDIIVTTGDLKEDYEIIGPVYFQVSNKGLFNSALNDLIKGYRNELTEMHSKGMLSEQRADWGFLYGEFSVGQNQFESAFYVSVQELKRRASFLDADAIICMRQDIDLDTNGFSYFYLQIYGTAVRLKSRQKEKEANKDSRIKYKDDFKNSPSGAVKPQPTDNPYLVTCPLCGHEQSKGRKFCTWCDARFVD